VSGRRDANATAAAIAALTAKAEHLKNRHSGAR